MPIKGGGKHFSSNFPKRTYCLSVNQSMKVKSESEVAQLCPTLCNPMDYSLTRFLCPWDFPGKHTGVGCHCLLQEIFPTQGLNLGLPHCRQTLYCLSHQGSEPEHSLTYTAVCNSSTLHGTKWRLN